MNEFTADAFANRGDPIPVIRLNTTHDLNNEVEDINESPHKEGTRERLRRHKAELKENIRKAHNKASETSATVQDRLLEKLLQQVIPIEDLSENRKDVEPINFVERPAFNITTMSNNFRRFNARIGVVFVFQAKVIRLLSWKQWSHTLSFLAVYTFVCLDPYLLTVLPLAVLLLAILIPSFIARHPAPPTTITADSFTYSTTGPPIAPAPTVKPVKELSKDFFRNMRDLQNCMEDFSQLHDQIITLISPSTNFSNEPLSSTLFLFLVVTAAFIRAQNPSKLVFKPSSLKTSSLIPPLKPAKSKSSNCKNSPRAGEWEHWLFSSSPYDPMSSMRIETGRPLGCRFFEDVKSPRGWEWSEKKWALDLWSREWVEERIITGVEVETEGERWVYDIRYEGQEEDPVGVVDTGSDMGSLRGRKGLPVSWEEASDVDGARRRGEWRRRRWVRMVKRRWEHDGGDADAVEME
ncbi:hypothetical protein EYC80_008417 [Monilinia laxa]|uniref:TECPR1-like DysF domain-containing protein n=1 Tax=Monilinia laxa TaxID=61186 RepID=A0A5N6JQ59_MONLA|nr:hypothetical protein EYC80_008417 [Monilinia laxa]